MLNISKSLFRASCLYLKNSEIIMACNKFSTKTHHETKIDIDGQTINYIKVGDGSKYVFCFPGALGTIWSDFKPQIDSLDKEKFTVIAWDPPGYGKSRPPSRNFDQKFYHTDADVAYKFLQKICVNKCSLLGWSDGGISSMILAAKYPGNVENLVIWGSNAYVIEEESKKYEEMRDISKWSDKMKKPLIEIYTEEGLRKMWSDWCNALLIISKNGGDICKGALKDIKCPTLILHGDKDPMIAKEHPDYLLNNIKNSKIYRFPHGKHNIHLRYAQDFNKIVTEFLLK